MAKAWKFNNNVNTDEIIPAKYNISVEPSELANYVFFESNPEFSKSVKSGDIIVAGRNFGCGSSREHAPIAIKAAGIKAIVAASFARIFFRKCINIGLPIFESKEASEAIQDSDEIEIDLEIGVIKNINSSTQVYIQPPSGPVLKLIKAGGLVEYVKNNDIESL